MKTMLITGASRGIGAATALLAAQHGYAVAVNYLNNKTAADQVVRKILADGGIAVAIQADVSQEDEIVRMFAAVDRQLGPLHCLVNNAGILEPQGKLINLDSGRLLRMFKANAI